MNPADTARQNAIPLEIKKDAMRQTQSGDWKITFTVQAGDMDQRLTSAAMGTRFQAALVEIGDDEMPVIAKKERLDWREVQPAAQAGIRCNDPNFQQFLWQEHAFTIQCLEDAEIAVRNLCGVKSRSELATNHKARGLWHHLDNQYREWAGL